MKDTQNITKETFNTYHDLMKNNNRETKTLAFKLITDLKRKKGRIIIIKLRCRISKNSQVTEVGRMKTLRYTLMRHDNS